MAERKQKECLLIWPPLAPTSNLALGIPFLTSYLKKHNFISISVLDLNVAYLKEMALAKNSQEANIQIKYENIPWSLKSILNYDFKKAKRKDEKIILELLNNYLNNSQTIQEQGTSDEPPENKSFVKKKSINLIGISVTHPGQLFFSVMLARIIKTKIDKNIYVVLGGAQITRDIKYIVRNTNIYDFVDCFVTHDGEKPLLSLLSGFSKKDLLNIPNLYFKKPEAHGYRKSRHTFRLHPNNFLPPDFTGFDLSCYTGPISIVASKGCFWSKCTFCTYALLEKHEFSICKPKVIINTIKAIKEKYGCTRYQFMDDALPPNFMKRLAAELIKEDLNIEWGASIIASNDFNDRQLCTILKDSGLRLLSIGIESMSPRILNLMNKCQKDINEENIKRILATLKTAGIIIWLNIIFGFPTETLAEARQTLDFLVKNMTLYDRLTMQPFSLEEGTYVFKHPEEFSITKIYKEDKNCGQRLGYRFESLEGMSQGTAKLFTHGEAALILQRVRQNQGQCKHN